MPAQREEVVVHADRRHAEHVTEQSTQDFLGRGARLPRCRGCPLRTGKRAAVQLPVGGQRERGQRDERRRHHVLGQHGPQLRPRAGGVEGLVGDHVGHEALVTRHVLAHHHRRRRDTGARGHRGTDLRGLDPVAAQLHLVVGPPRVLQLTVRRPPRGVTRAVHARSRRPERAGHEPVGGEVGTAGVPEGDTGARDVQLPGHPGRHRPQPGVEDVGAPPRQRPADRGRRVGRGEPSVCHVHGRLGDPVHVHQRRAVRVPGEPVVERRPVQCLAAEHDEPHGKVRGRVRVGAGQLGERGRGLAEHRDLLGGEHPQQVGCGAGDVARHEHHAGARAQRTPQLPHGEVEPHRVAQRPHVVDAEAEQVAGRGGQCRHRAVRHHHALGPSGRTGGEDDVGGAVRADRAAAFVVADVVGRQRTDPRVAHGARADPEVDRLLGLAVRHDEPGTAVRDDPAHALVRPLDVGGHVRRARLQHRERGHGERRRRRQREHDAVFRPHPGPQQQAGEPVRAGVQLPVGQLLAARDHGDLVAPDA